MNVRLLVPRFVFALMLMSSIIHASAEEVPGVGPAQLATAKAALASAALVVIGEPQPDFIVLATIKELASSDPEKKIQSGTFNYTDAFKILKDKVTKAGDGTQTVENAFKAVYGRPSHPAEMAYWRPKVAAGSTWYAPIVTAETAKMNKDSFARRQMIERCYLNVFGRVDTEAERGYWLPRVESYHEMHTANVGWLYSAKGANDLKETVERVLYDRYLNVTAADISKLTSQAVKDKLTFAAMQALQHAR